VNTSANRLLRTLFVISALASTGCSERILTMTAPASVSSYWIDCNGTDASGDIALAISNINAAGGGLLLLGPGTCIDNDTITLAPNGAGIIGSGERVSTLVTSSATASQIAVTAHNFYIAGLSLRRTAPPSEGADGIDACLSENCGYPTISGVDVAGSYNGIQLGPAAYGRLRHAITERNAGDGVLLRGNSNSNNLQWAIVDVLSQRNSGNGFNVVGFPGVPDGTLGPWFAPYTYNNRLNGINIQGLPTASINNGQFMDGFLGSDCLDEIHLDSYGQGFTIANMQSEFAGHGAGCAAPPLGAGNGLKVTPNNQDVHVTSSQFRSAWANGIETAGTRVTIEGGDEIHNGHGGNLFDENGIAVTAGTVAITGGFSDVNPGWGIMDWSPLGVYATGVVCSRNAAGAHSGPVSVSGGSC
jgi:hypothetical protein